MPPLLSYTPDKVSDPRTQVRRGAPQRTTADMAATAVAAEHARRRETRKTAEETLGYGRARATPMVAAAMNRFAQFQSSLPACLAFMLAICATGVAGLLLLTNHEPLCSPTTYTSYKQRSLTVCGGVTFIILAVAGIWLFSLRRSAHANNAALAEHTRLLLLLPHEYDEWEIKSRDRMSKAEARCRAMLIYQVNCAIFGCAAVVWVFGIVGISVFACDAVCWTSQKLPEAGASHHKVSFAISVSVLTVAEILLLACMFRTADQDDDHKLGDEELLEGYV
jgi:hypothetical protein